VLTDRYHVYKRLFQEESFPLLFLDLDVLEENIKEIDTRVTKENVTIRIASKSVRSVDIIKYILNHSTKCDGIMAYSGKEVCYLLESGFNNILLAYPIVNEREIEEILLQSQGKTVVLMIDSMQHLEMINQIASKHNIIAQVCMDIDMSMNFFGLYFGVYRSSIKSVEKALELGKEILKLDNVVLTGIMGYEAQIAGVGDRSPARNIFLNGVVRLLKKSSIPKIAKLRKQVVEELVNQGHNLSLVNGGGTGSVETTIKEDVITEVTVGSGFYSPVLFDYYNSFKHQPALAFALQITRIPQQNIVTCHGGGYIASGAIASDKQPQPYLPKDCKLIQNEGAGEVQTPLKTNFSFSVGDPVFFRHAKAGELCEHFNEIILVKQGEIINRVKTYRGAEKVFL
jgi:D-serine deaminase-like pyridoxal phosphate-dependent protein